MNTLHSKWIAALAGGLAVSLVLGVTLLLLVLSAVHGLSDVQAYDHAQSAAQLRQAADAPAAIKRIVTGIEVAVERDVDMHLASELHTSVASIERNLGHDIHVAVRTEAQRIVRGQRP